MQPSTFSGVAWKEAVIGPTLSCVDQKKPAHIGHELIDWLDPRPKRILQWDSWRFWEAMAAGCVAIGSSARNRQPAQTSGPEEDSPGRFVCPVRIRV